jgi:predicted DNA binding CopG/RHH family protein
MADSSSTGDLTWRDFVDAEVSEDAGEKPAADTGRSATITVRVTPEEKAKVKGQASGAGLSMSEYARRRMLERPIQTKAGRRHRHLLAQLTRTLVELKESVEGRGGALAQRLAAEVGEACQEAKALTRVLKDRLRT